VVAGAESPGRALAERRAELGRIAGIETFVLVIDVVIVSALAYWLKSALALGIGSLLRSLIDVGLSYAVFPARPRAQIDPVARREFLGAGREFLLMAIGSYVTIYGDNLAVGSFLGAHALGIYVVAYKLAELPLSVLVAVTKRLFFPVLSRLQHDRELLRQLVTESLLAQVLIVWPTAIGACLFADVLIPALYGAEYVEAIPVLRALVFLTLGRSVANMFVTVLMAAGRYDQLSSLKWLEVVVFVPTLLIGLWLGGLVGAALGTGLAYLFAAGIRIVTICREQGLTGRDQALVFGLPTLLVIVAAGAAWLVREMLHAQPIGASFALSCGVFCLVYIGAAVPILGGRLTQLFQFFTGRR
jgi:O-antigen/teichoic acid export membrane protein